MPTLALRGGLSGLFVDFDLLPDLFAGLDQSSERTATVAGWSALLEASGFDSRAIDPHELPVPQPAATLAADGAWRLAERLGFIASGTLTDLGREVAAFAELDSESRRESLAPVLAKGVESALLGQGGLPIVPLLRRAAECLAASTNLWARECPGLVPVEVGAIVYWACVDAQRAHILVRDIEINRDVAMHRVGHPEADAPPGANAERHFERILEFYLDHPDLGLVLSYSAEVGYGVRVWQVGGAVDKNLQGSAVTVAFKRHESALRAFVSHMVESPADVDDVTQEAFLRAFNADPWTIRSKERPS